MQRNNYTNEHTVHGPTRPSSWELKLEEQIIKRVAP
jgi:hypothetical protein